MDADMPTPATRTEHDKRVKLPNSTEPVVWLDLLPIDTCARVASLLPSWRFNSNPQDRFMGNLIEWHSDPFNLANVSDIQRRAAVISMNHVIRLERPNDSAHALSQLTFWGTLLGDQLHEVHLPSKFHYQFDEGLHDTLSLRSIRKATIPNSQSLMRALVAGRSVRQLEIEMMRIIDVHIIERVTVSDILKSCPIEHLSIICNSCIYTRRRCLTMKALKAMNRDPKCETIASLKLTCPAGRIHDIANAVPALPNLENLCLQHWFPKPPVPNRRIERIIDLAMSPACKEQLCSLKSVSMLNCGTVDVFAPLLGKRLTKLASKDTVSCEDIRKLENCPNLESLELLLDDGAEKYFPTNLRSLQSITLSWSHIEKGTLEPKKHAPNPEFFIGLVRRNKQLRKLHLQEVIIPHSIQEEILVSLGDRLESLQLPLSDASEHAEHMMKQLLKLIMVHNPNISNLVFEEVLVPELLDTVKGCKTHRYEKHIPPDVRAACEKCQRWEHIDVVWNVLKRRLPKLDYSSIEQFRLFFYMYDYLVRRNGSVH